MKFLYLEGSIFLKVIFFFSLQIETEKFKCLCIEKMENREQKSQENITYES